MKIIKLLTLAVLLVALALVLPGCVTANKFIAYGIKHPDIASQFCADEYPAQDSLIEGKTDTVIVTNTRIDTVTTTIVNEVTGKTQTIKLPCPPCNQSTRTITKTDTIVRVDQAKVTALTHQYNNQRDLRIIAESDLVKSEKEGKRKNWIITSLSLALFACLVWIFKK